jgi:nucleoside-diphosphate-sugar epimerase
MKEIDWAPSISLRSGIEKTYQWIFDTIVSGENTKKFSKF